MDVKLELMIGENSALEFFFLIHRITQNVQSKHKRSIGYNYYIYVGIFN